MFCRSRPFDHSRGVAERRRVQSWSTESVQNFRDRTVNRRLLLFTLWTPREFFGKLQKNCYHLQQIASREETRKVWVETFVLNACDWNLERLLLQGRIQTFHNEGRKVGSTKVARIEAPRRWGIPHLPSQKNFRVLSNWRNVVNCNVLNLKFFS